MVPTAIVNAFRGGILSVIDEGVNRIVFRFDHLFASVSIANSEGKTEEEMAVPVKGVAYHIAFDGLVKMDLPENAAV